MGWLINLKEKPLFVYHSKQQTEVFDQPESQISVPAFASEVKLTVAELFSWLLE